MQSYIPKHTGDKWFPIDIIFILWKFILMSFTPKICRTFLYSGKIQLIQCSGCWIAVKNLQSATYIICSKVRTSEAYCKSWAVSKGSPKNSIDCPTQLSSNKANSPITLPPNGLPFGHHSLGGIPKMGRFSKLSLPSSNDKNFEGEEPVSTWDTIIWKIYIMSVKTMVDNLSYSSSSQEVVQNWLPGFHV